MGADTDWPYFSKNPFLPLICPLRNHFPTRRKENISSERINSQMTHSYEAAASSLVLLSLLEGHRSQLYLKHLCYPNEPSSWGVESSRLTAKSATHLSRLLWRLRTLRQYVARSCYVRCELFSFSSTLHLASIKMASPTAPPSRDCPRPMPRSLISLPGKPSADVAYIFLPPPDGSRTILVLLNGLDQGMGAWLPQIRYLRSLPGFPYIPSILAYDRYG